MREPRRLPRLPWPCLKLRLHVFSELTLLRGRERACIVDRAASAMQKCLSCVGLLYLPRTCSWHPRQRVACILRHTPKSYGCLNQPVSLAWVLHANHFKCKAGGRRAKVSANEALAPRSLPCSAAFWP